MKKPFLLLISLAFPISVFGQSGNGSSGNPFYGTITTSVQWSVGNPDYGSTVYVGSSTNPDLTIGDGGQLTIDPGITVIFSQLGSDLIITGTGTLIAQGNSSNNIIFTKLPGNSNWGHISFEGSTGISILDFCQVSYGKKVGSGTAGYGGAIQISTDHLTISNSVILNNSGTFGGGIFVNNYADPVIRNCKIYANSATASGGGVYLWYGSGAILENCIIYNNICTNTGTNGGGGLGIYTGSGNTKLINCTIASNLHNTPYSKRGNDIYLNSTNNNLRLINCTVWGSDDNSVFIDANPVATNFVNSAIRRIYNSSGEVPITSYTNSLNLNSSNTGISPSGPNFIDPVNYDFTISFISPLRDAGTIPTPAVTSDYAGNPRVYHYDIGAYEYQYSRWKTTAGSTDWNASDNWYGGVPTSILDVLIPTGASNYPIGSTTQDFTTGSGKQIIIEPGARVTLGNLTNNGIIKLNHTASGFASLVINSYTRGTGGSEEIQLYLTGGGTEGPPADYKWHYISSPVSSLSTDLFSALTIDLAQFVESRPSISLAQGWVAYDGYVYSTGATNGPTFSSLSTGKGYNFWDNGNNTITFGGLFNTSNSVISLGYSGLPTMHGFNLLGNPFSSGLNWDDIINGIYSPYPANTSKGLYFTRDNVQCSYIAGVGIPSDVTGIIPPMQGFFVKTYSTGNSITLPAAARTHNNIHSRYKGETIIPLVRLAIFEDKISNDETVVRFDEAAKSTLDNDFDALKMFLSSTKTTIHTALGGTNYAINGQPFPQPENLLEIPVVVNVISSGTHKISATQLQGLDSYGVSLTDKTTGFTSDLKTSPVVTFSASPGLLSNRFILKISNISTGSEDLYSNDNSFNIYRNFNYINIQTIADEWDGKTGSVKVLDMSGKTVSDLSRTEFRKTSVTQVEAPPANGLYFIEIKSGVNRFVGKVVIK